jgi:hypothetical protein
MNTKSHQLFAQLCEGIINEASTGLDLVRGQTGGEAVIKQLHASNQLSHDQEYRPIDKITWSMIKDSRSWVIIQGARGTGAIKTTNSGGYYAVASNGGEVQSSSNSRSDAITTFLKSIIGNFKKYYTGRDSGTASKLQRDRANQNTTAEKTMDVSKLMLKFKPLWARGITAAIADIKGMIGIMIKNDAFEKAEHKIALLRKLANTLDNIEAGDSREHSIISSAVQSAVMMTASHYYPEQTGELTRSRNYGGGTTYNSQRSEGMNQLLKDIAGGDTAKLGTVLGFFKRSLIAS